MKNSKLTIIKALSACCLLHFTFLICAPAQETPPAPSAPRVAKIPLVAEKELPNGLTVAVAERKNVPLVTIQLLVKSGARTEELEKAGLANLTASLLTKGTKTRTATQIAEQMEFLGATIEAGADWNNSILTINVMSDKLDQAMAILADLVLNPKFDQKEIDLLKSQSQDNLAQNLEQPGFLANYVASKYSFYEHPAEGTPQSLSGITRTDILNFKKENFIPNNSILIFTGDITAAKGSLLAKKYFGVWKMPPPPKEMVEELPAIFVPMATKGNVQRNLNGEEIIFRRLLVIDLPNSGQAAVSYAKDLGSKGRFVWNEAKKQWAASEIYFPAIVLNSVLGGGYSARLNQEIRIKRGLSYGAGSSLAWRGNNTNFGTRTQTKNVSAAEVAELVLAEIQKLTDSSVAENELAPRKLVLTGDFGRDLETTQGLADRLAELYSFNLPASELNSYAQNVKAVSDGQIKDFAVQNLKGGDLIIVGDYAVFKDDLKKRFPTIQIEVIKADELDLSAENLRKK